MELLRIIAMVLVLIVHSSFKALDVPSQTDLDNQPFSSFLCFFSESIAIICVNVFILISGWFGIRPNIIRFIEFIFQVLFIRIIIYFFLYSFGLTEKWNITDWIKLLTFHKGLWFVNAYIILYFFSPVLNAFINSATKHQFQKYFSLFFLFSLYLVLLIALSGIIADPLHYHFLDYIYLQDMRNYILIGIQYTLNILIFSYI